MAGVRINELGAIIEGTRTGTQVDNNAVNSDFLPYKQVSVGAHITSTMISGTLTGQMAIPGLQTISGAVGVSHSITLPTASQHPGAMFAFRCLSVAVAHILTGSGEAPISGLDQLGAIVNGSSLTLGSAVGSGVVLFCDGLKYRVMAGSGSITGT